MNVPGILPPVAALVGAFAIGVSAMQSVALAGGSGVTQLNVVEHAITDIPLDVGAPGASLGDSLTFVNEIFDETDTTQIGDDRGFCSLVEVGISYYCTFIVSLAEGNITVAGPFFIDGRPSTFVITGGTGIYSNAGGQMAFTFRDSEAGFPKYNVAIDFAQ